MFLRVADDGDANAETVGDGTFWNSFRSVVRALGVNVGAQLLEQFLDVGLVEENHEIDIAQGGNEFQAGVFVQNGTAGAFQAENAGIGIDGDDQDVTLFPGAGKITHVANVQRVKATVGKDDALAMALGTFEKKTQGFARFNFRFGFTHTIRVRPGERRRVPALLNGTFIAFCFQAN